MRFVCDQDVDARVAGVLRQAGHEAWTANDAGLADASDEALAIYAQNKNAVLVTHDVDFSRWRRKWTIGQHLHLRCVDTAAADLISRRIADVVPVLERHADLFVLVTVERVQFTFGTEGK